MQHTPAVESRQQQAHCEEVARTLRVFCADGHRHEVRALPPHGSTDRPASLLGSYPDDADRLITFALEREAAGYGVYLVLNPVQAGQLRTLKGDKVKTVHSAGDEHVLRRRWLLVDCDPRRSAGTMATEAEKQAAKDVADAVLADLDRLGIAGVVEADSGNGYHLVVPLDLPNDDASRDACREFLRDLDARLGNDAVKIDTSVYNAARIVRLHGTLNRKGEDTSERPHRRSRILRVAEDVDDEGVVRRNGEAIITHVAGVLERQRAERAAHAEAQRRHLAEGRHQDRREVEKRAAAYLAKIPEAVSGQGGHGHTFWAARVLVRGFLLDPETALALLLSDYNPRCRPSWTEGELRHKVEDAVGKPFGKPWGWCMDETTARSSTTRQASERKDAPDDEDDEDGGEGEKGGRGPSLATQLVNLAVEVGADLFHSPSNVAYASVLVPERAGVPAHRENWPLRSQGFKSWLAMTFFLGTKKAANGQALGDAVNILEGLAVHHSPEYDVPLRVAGDRSTIYIDLGTPDWQAVKVTADGWSLVSDVPVKFIRRKASRPLPTPCRGGTLGDLQPFVNARDDDGWTLAVGWLLASLRPWGPYPLLLLLGEQGCSKSTLARLLKLLIDPSAAPLRGEPKSPDDLAVCASNNHLLAYDNFSRLDQSMSDALCSIATGGGIGKRGLYTDADEVVLEFCRPVIITSIVDVVTASDLLDRSFLLPLKPIEQEKRKTEEEVMAAFRAAHPKILGAVLTALAVALKNRDMERVDDLPRMADAALWVEAAAPALGWERGRFVAAVAKNVEAANETAVESSPVAEALLRLLRERCQNHTFEGTASALLDQLNTLANGNTQRSREWPKSASSLSGALRRVEPNLRRMGVTIDRGTDTAKRLITVALKRKE